MKIAGFLFNAESVQVFSAEAAQSRATSEARSKGNQRAKRRAKRKAKSEAISEAISQARGATKKGAKAWPSASDCQKGITKTPSMQKRQCAKNLQTTGGNVSEQRNTHHQNDMDYRIIKCTRLGAKQSHTHATYVIRKFTLQSIYAFTPHARRYPPMIPPAQTTK